MHWFRLPTKAILSPTLKTVFSTKYWIEKGLNKNTTVECHYGYVKNVKEIINAGNIIYTPSFNFSPVFVGFSRKVQRNGSRIFLKIVGLFRLPSHSFKKTSICAWKINQLNGICITIGFYQFEWQYSLVLQTNCSYSLNRRTLQVSIHICCHQSLL